MEKCSGRVSWIGSRTLSPMVTTTTFDSTDFDTIQLETLPLKLIHVYGTDIFL